MPQIVLGTNRGGDWPGVWFASLAANPGLVCQPGGQPGAGLLSWRPTWRLARKSPAGIPRRAGTLGTGMEELLSTEPLALLPWEPGGEPWKSSCDMPAGTFDTDLLEVLWETLNGGLGASIKRTPGVIEMGHFRAFRGLAHGGGVFQLRSMVISFRGGT